MPRTKSDIANSAIRIFLQDVGKFYDEVRGLDPFRPKRGQKQELLEAFGHQCCYCGEPIDENSLSQDHLIPMNKASLGLHAWGNVVPCCKDCNNEKQQTDWKKFLAKKTVVSKRRKRVAQIQKFVRDKAYDPNLNLHEYADNLYQDVGEVALTLIRLRYKQAKQMIRELLEEKAK